MLNWEKDESSTVYGYKIKYDTCPIFVTYHKKEDIAKSTMYEDAFVNNQIFSWMTRSRVKEHEAARWLTREELDFVDWLPADVLLIDTLKQSKFITPEKEV